MPLRLYLQTTARPRSTRITFNQNLIYGELNKFVGVGASYRVECLTCPPGPNNVRKLGFEDHDAKGAARAFEVLEKAVSPDGFDFVFTPLSPADYSAAVELASGGAVKIPPSSIPPGTMVLSFNDSTPEYTEEAVEGSPGKNWIETTNGDRHSNVGFGHPSNFWTSRFASDDLGLMQYIPSTEQTGVIRFGLTLLPGSNGYINLDPVTLLLAEQGRSRRHLPLGQRSRYAGGATVPSRSDCRPRLR